MKCLIQFVNVEINIINTVLLNGAWIKSTIFINKDINAQNAIKTKVTPIVNLIDKGCSTRYDIGIGEYSYGITMIPCEWVLPYLKQLQEVDNHIKKLEDVRDFAKTDKSGYSDSKIEVLNREIEHLKEILKKGD